MKVVSHGTDHRKDLEAMIYFYECQSINARRAHLLERERKGKMAAHQDAAVLAQE